MIKPRTLSPALVSRACYPAIKILGHAKLPVLASDRRLHQQEFSIEYRDEPPSGVCRGGPVRDWQGGERWVRIARRSRAPGEHRGAPQPKTYQNRDCPE